MFAIDTSALWACLVLGHSRMSITYSAKIFPLDLAASDWLFYELAHDVARDWYAYVVWLQKGTIGSISFLI